MDRLPSLFLSHGAPTFALERGLAGRALHALGLALPRPAAVLVVSAHWMTPAPRVGGAARPATMHDFGGFPAALYRLSYPASGHPELARRTVEVLRASGWPAELDPDRGLDHGAWVPLMHLYPRAEMPVFQVSLPQRLTADLAWAFGQSLAPLAAEGVLIVGSGSLTHNLAECRFDQVEAAAYVEAFAAWVREAVLTHDAPRLRQTLERAPQAHRAHPTTEHFWPLLVAAGAADQAAAVSVIEGGVTYGVLAMDGFRFGD